MNGQDSARARPAPITQTDDRRRVAQGGDAAEAPASRSLRQMGQALNRGPAVQAQLTLQRALNDRAAQPETIAVAPASEPVLQRPAAPVVQFGKWNKAKVKRYMKHLVRRGSRRVAKRKPVHKLVRKYVKARKRADPRFHGLRLADAPSAGHHVPALALANRRRGTLPFGQRGSAGERQRRRLYLHGTSDQRSNAHGIMHMAETFAGLGSRNEANFRGTDEDMAERYRVAHQGLTLDDGTTPISVSLQSQTDHESGVATPAPVPVHEATNEILEDDHALADDEEDYMDDDTDSEPESDEALWDSDSGSDDSDEEEEDDEEPPATGAVSSTAMVS